ncbi:hypothetical protein HII31_03845 [Pseudocercospora fuligena]|uniref:Uncharacterized protein n=1 Tax=Pseudocercospora fuligena TaxID=685502 RepID=A0A8H6RPJ1_9PEZI|nr:hypothetical protein HII31_03845 [Pseudocercospora fuligena]
MKTLETEDTLATCIFVYRKIGRSKYILVVEPHRALTLTRLKDFFCSWIELKCLRHNEKSHHYQSREAPSTNWKRDIAAHTKGDSSSDCSDSSLTDIETEDEDDLGDPDYIEGPQLSSKRRTLANRRMDASDASSVLLAQRAIQDLVNCQEVTREATTTPWNGAKPATPVTNSISVNGKRQASQDASALKRLCTNASALIHGEREPSRTATPSRGDRGLSAVSARLGAIPIEVSASNREKRELLAALRLEHDDAKQASYESTSALAMNLKAKSHPAVEPTTLLQLVNSTDIDVHKVSTNIPTQEANSPAQIPRPRTTNEHQGHRSVSNVNDQSSSVVPVLPAVSAADLSARSPKIVDVEHNRSTRERNVTIPSMPPNINEHIYESLPPMASDSKTTRPDGSDLVATSIATPARTPLGSNTFQMDLTPA